MGGSAKPIGIASTAVEEGEKSKSFGRASVDPAGRILRAARAMFLSDGFERASVDRLAREAGVSKATIYKYFGSLSAVLRAIAEAEVDGQFPAAFRPEDDPDTLKERLIDVGTSLLKVIETPEKLEFDRLVHETARHQPELAAVYFASIYQRTLDHLAEGIRIGQRSGHLRRDVSAEILADQLLSMWLGTARTRKLLGLPDQDRPPPDARSREAVLTLWQGVDRVP